MVRTGTVIYCYSSGRNSVRIESDNLEKETSNYLHSLSVLCFYFLFCPYLCVCLESKQGQSTVLSFCPYSISISEPHIRLKQGPSTVRIPPREQTQNRSCYLTNVNSLFLVLIALAGTRHNRHSRDNKLLTFLVPEQGLHKFLKLVLGSEMGTVNFLFLGPDQGQRQQIADIPCARVGFA